MKFDVQKSLIFCVFNDSVSNKLITLLNLLHDKYERKITIITLFYAHIYHLYKVFKTCTINKKLN